MDVNGIKDLCPRRCRMHFAIRASPGQGWKRQQTKDRKINRGALANLKELYAAGTHPRPTPEGGKVTPNSWHLHVQPKCTSRSIPQANTWAERHRARCIDAITKYLRNAFCADVDTLSPRRYAADVFVVVGEMESGSYRTSPAGTIIFKTLAASVTSCIVNADKPPDGALRCKCIRRDFLATDTTSRLPSDRPPARKVGDPGLDNPYDYTGCLEKV
ncbi:alkyl hydroperoxide reductase [Anopheles sinensis]|uniref:Alkyl hydroperoxide reductase n=1 Tax=Anopheles sinensis TaxID=74873 RepID=A0A084WBR1_ANOSI|nr:alkyl hydroperoxide reductase [Anopheles sinensis]